MFSLQVKTSPASFLKSSAGKSVAWGLYPRHPWCGPIQGNRNPLLSSPLLQPRGHSTTGWEVKHPQGAKQKRGIAALCCRALCQLLLHWCKSQGGSPIHSGLIPPAPFPHLRPRSSYSIALIPGNSPITVTPPTSWIPGAWHHPVIFSLLLWGPRFLASPSFPSNTKADLHQWDLHMKLLGDQSWMCWKIPENLWQFCTPPITPKLSFNTGFQIIVNPHEKIL